LGKLDRIKSTEEKQETSSDDVIQVKK